MASRVYESWMSVACPVTDIGQPAYCLSIFNILNLTSDMGETPQDACQLRSPYAAFFSQSFEAVKAR